MSSNVFFCFTMFRDCVEITMENVSDKQLEQLQARVEEMSASLRSNGSYVDEAIVNLEKNVAILASRLADHELQVNNLRSQVENLAQINANIDRKCFKTTFAKPEL